MGTLIAIGLAYRSLVRGLHGDDPQGTVWMLLPAWIDHIALGMGLAVVSAALVGTQRSRASSRLIERRPGVLLARDRRAVLVRRPPGSG